VRPWDLYDFICRWLAIPIKAEAAHFFRNRSRHNKLWVSVKNGLHAGTNIYILKFKLSLQGMDKYFLTDMICRCGMTRSVSELSETSIKGTP
jgi:hypothetical protein